MTIDAPVPDRSRRRQLLRAAVVVAVLAGLAVAAAVVIGNRGNSNAKLLAQLQNYAGCMRAHGLPKFPEPTKSSDGGFGFHVPISVQRSASYQPALRACSGQRPTGF